MSQHESDAPLVASATLARRATRALSNTLIVVFGFGSVIWLLSTIFYDEMGGAGSAMFAAGVVVASISLAGAAFWLINALRRAWTRLMLRRDLHARLTAAGARPRRGQPRGAGAARRLLARRAARRQPRARRSTCDQLAVRAAAPEPPLADV
jgi:hypothetical protein